MGSGFSNSINRSGIIYKFAETKEELEQIYKLNYQTFVEEIPQHPRNDFGTLIDKFDRENTYLIALNGDEIIGMLAFNDKRPFSLDYKIPDLDKYLPHTNNLIEFRLLAVKNEKRGGVILVRMIEQLVKYGIENNKHYKLALISGTTRQLRIYSKMGFVPFYELVGTKDALYQPMYLDAEKFTKNYVANQRIVN